MPDTHPQSQPPSRTQAFTLIELLVVVGVIALLIAILLPVLGAARRTGKTAVCASNLRTLGQATMMYTTDFDRYLPQPTTNGGLANAVGGALGQRMAGRALWFNAVDYYLEQLHKDYKQGDTGERNYVRFKQDPVWLELTEEDLMPNVGGDIPPDRLNQQTIKMNRKMGLSKPSENKWKFYRVTEIASPANTALYVDGRAFDTPSTTTGKINGSEFGAAPDEVGLRHQDGANVAKVDGSVSHHTNPVTTSTSGYRGWHDDDTSDDNSKKADNLANQANWPDVIFDWQNRKF